MRLRSTATLLIVPLTLLTACGHTAAKSVDRPTAGHLTASPGDDECASVIPDAVLTALGWTPGGAAVSESETCVRSASGGKVSVLKDARTDGSMTFRAACTSLPIGGAAEDPVSWLPGSQGCADTQTIGSATQLHLVVLTPRSKVLHIEVDADTAVASDALHAATALLVTAADEQL